MDEKKYMLAISIATASFWSMWSKVRVNASMREEGINPNRGNQNITEHNTKTYSQLWAIWFSQDLPTSMQA